MVLTRARPCFLCSLQALRIDRGRADCFKADPSEHTNKGCEEERCRPRISSLAQRADLSVDLTFSLARELDGVINGGFDTPHEKGLNRDSETVPNANMSKGMGVTVCDILLCGVSRPRPGYTSKIARCLWTTPDS